MSAVISTLVAFAPTMSSGEIAELVESRHDKVKQSIERLVERGHIVQPPMGNEPDFDAFGRTRDVMVYRVCQRDSYIVVAQLSPEFTARLVDRWQELEASTVSMIPKTMAQALRLAADQAEQIEQQQAQLAVAAPKIEFVDRYVESTGSKGFREVCKLLGANEARFRGFLSDNKIMYRLGDAWVPKQQHLDAGRFNVKAGTCNVSNHAFNQARFTPKGVQWVAGLWIRNRSDISEKRLAA